MRIILLPVWFEAVLRASNTNPKALLNIANVKDIISPRDLAFYATAQSTDLLFESVYTGSADPIPKIPGYLGSRVIYTPQQLESLGKKFQDHMLEFATDIAAGKLTRSDLVFGVGKVTDQHCIDVQPLDDKHLMVVWRETASSEDHAMHERELCRKVLNIYEQYQPFENVVATPVFHRYLKLLACDEVYE